MYIHNVSLGLTGEPHGSQRVTSKNHFLEIQCLKVIFYIMVFLRSKVIPFNFLSATSVIYVYNQVFKLYVNENLFLEPNSVNCFVNTCITFFGDDLFSLILETHRFVKISKTTVYENFKDMPIS